MKRRRRIIRGHQLVLALNLLDAVETGERGPGEFKPLELAILEKVPRRIRDAANALIFKVLAREPEGSWKLATGACYTNLFGLLLEFLRDHADDIADVEFDIQWFVEHVREFLSCVGAQWERERYQRAIGLILSAVASGEITEEMRKEPYKELRAPRGKPARQAQREILHFWL